MVRNKRTRELIYNMIQKLKEEYKPEKIILFGSFAWGKPNKHSDVDLFIIKRTKERHIDRSVKIREILDEENGQIALDPIVYSPEEVKQRLRIGDDFIKRIINKGIVLYG